jgi:His Kinase A (phospho-acceptor) domain
VRFDDRLLTVLSQPATDRHDAAVRWRQLVDLVARAGPHSASPVVAKALESIRADAPNVDENLRAAAARAIAALPLPLGLLQYFASDRLSVSAPVLAAATLEPDQWRALVAGADDETRQFVEALHPEIAAPEADLTETLVEPEPEPEAEKPAVGPEPEQPEPTPEPEAQKPKAKRPSEPDATEALVEPEREKPKPKRAPPAPAAPAGPSLSEVVARIERRRRHRGLPQAGRPATAPIPAAAAPMLFRWECGPGGEIAWVDGAPRGPLIGRSIARIPDNEGNRLDEEVVRAFAMRAPFRDGTMVLAGDGLVSGEWKITGVPAFEPADGRFAGYRGIALRDAPTSERSDTLEILSDPDSLRELVHEIKTPLNAIIGFAEIIDGQYLGPADRRYRERAAEIVAQARILLSAIDDLDFAAQVHSDRPTEGRRVDLGEQLDRAADSLRDIAGKRKVELEIARAQRIAAAAIEPELADRLIFRLCTAVIGAAEAGETLRLSVEQAGENCRFSISRPAALKGASDAQLFDASSAAANGFSLRLVRGLARIAGGDLVTSPSGFTLVFPRA